MAATPGRRNWGVPGPRWQQGHSPAVCVSIATPRQGWDAIGLDSLMCVALPSRHLASIHRRAGGTSPGSLRTLPAV